MKQIRSLVVTGFGINCEEETAAAYRLAGAEADIVHINDIFYEQCSIHDYDILNFPGGFSFGDDLGSARVLANKLRYKKMRSGGFFLDVLLTFLSEGKYLLGICNGFQLLVKMGILPNIDGNMEQEVTLTYNDSGKFEDRWCHVKVSDSARTPFLKNMKQFDVPVRHGEGKLLIRDAEVRKYIVEHGLNCLSYCDTAGNPSSHYPENPNGSEICCAGLTDISGHIFGLMPHPEAFISIYNHPGWAQMKRQNPNLPDDGEGLLLFKNIVNHLKGAQHG